MPSWHPLSPRWLRFAILAPLASEAGSRGTGGPELPPLFDEAKQLVELGLRVGIPTKPV
jgi:hypothetical protein